MKALSLFSGVGGMDLGLERAGITTVAMCEIDPHARSVLARHWPDTPIYTDVTTFDGKEWHGRVDLVHGGSPCQDLSVAGRRQGLDGDRSGLFWHQCRIAAECAAPWILWENVPGALSSNNGTDFAAVLFGLCGAFPDVPADGWRNMGCVVGPERFVVWSVLDARWFGVAQRRRRVFALSGPRALIHRGIEVLFEPESCDRDSQPSATTRQGTTTNPARRSDKHRRDEFVGSLTAMDGWERPDNAHAEAGWLVPVEVMPTLPAALGMGGMGHNKDSFVVPVPFVKVVRSGARDAEGNLPPEVWAERDTAPTLNAMDNGGDTRATVLAVSENQRGEVRLTDYARQLTTGGGKPGQGYPAILAPTLTAANDPSRSPQATEVTQQIEAIHAASLAVRRLTPIECERLMGWPDNWTLHRHDGKEQADSHRYKQCGNGVVSNVTEWIGTRLLEATQ